MFFPGTLPAASPIQIALMSDTHWGSLSLSNQASYRVHLDQAITAINSAAVQLVLIAGDLTESGKTDDLKQVKEQFQKLRAPYLCIPGNHDIGAKVIPSQTASAKSKLSSKRLLQYEAIIGPSFFVRETAGVRVVGINSPILGSGLPEEEAQWQLLEKELGQPSTKPTLCLSHYPLFIAKADEPGGVYWNVEPGPRARLLKLLKLAGVKAVLSGHTHTTITNQVDGVTYLTTAPVSYGLPRGKQPEGWTLLTIGAEGETKFEIKNLNR